MATSAKCQISIPDEPKPTTKTSFCQKNKIKNKNYQNLQGSFSSNIKEPSLYN